ncbi:MAG: hypothetical protein JWR37_1155 [Mycobacterium sp.]|nr:hypothetical protein [Mycobacterium sp.]
MTAADLRSEYLTDPIGVDATDPRLSWVPTASVGAERQTAYQIQVADDTGALTAGHDLTWDSGWVASAQSWSVHYAGRPLLSGDRYVWRVRLWDSASTVSTWSSPAYWQMDLLDDAAWHGAQWIGAAAATDPAAVHLRRSLTQPAATTSSSAGTSPLVNWPSTTATYRKANR